MAGQQTTLPIASAKGKKARDATVEELEHRWLRSQSTGQLMILLQSVTQVLHGRGLRLEFRVLKLAARDNGG